MWAVFTYVYNSILIIFIAIHLLVGALITFCVGVYIGIYLSQNYQIPRIDEPFKLWRYFVKFLEERRKPGGMSIFPSVNKLNDNESDKDKDKDEKSKSKSNSTSKSPSPRPSLNNSLNGSQLQLISSKADSILHDFKKDS